VKLTPLDIRKQTFRKTMRGFDPEDVRVFLDLIADEYEQILQENGMLNEKVRHLSDQIERYHTMEKTLQNSLLTAERVSEEARERARLEADAVVADARQRGERILEDSRERLRQLSRHVQELHREKDLFLQRFLSFLDGQMQFLRAHEGELHEIDAIDTQAGEYLADTVRRGNPTGELEYPGEAMDGRPAGRTDESAAGYGREAEGSEDSAWTGMDETDLPEPLAKESGGLPVSDRLPLSDRTPLSERMPMAERAPVSERTPAPERVPVAERTPVSERLPVPERMVERTPVAERVPSPERAPVIDRRPAAERAPGASRPPMAERVPGSVRPPAGPRPAEAPDRVRQPHLSARGGHDPSASPEGGFFRPDRAARGFFDRKHRPEDGQ